MDPWAGTTTVTLMGVDCVKLPLLSSICSGGRGQEVSPVGCLRGCAVQEECGGPMRIVDVEVGQIETLREKAREARRLIVESIFRAQAGHLGGPLSAADILVAL